MVEVCAFLGFEVKNMAAKKFYAVRKGHSVGLFESWEVCKNSVDGFPGAEYKGFTSREEAVDYLEQAGIVVSKQTHYEIGNSVIAGDAHPIPAHHNETSDADTFPVFFKVNVTLNPP